MPCDAANRGLGRLFLRQSQSEAMAIAAESVTGQRVEVLQFQDIEFQDEFDGVWACATLVHVPRAKLSDVLFRFGRALRSNGVCYASFKEGVGDRLEEGRLFSDMTDAQLRSLIRGNLPFKLVELWHSEDLRPD